MYTREQIEDKLKEILEELFEIDPAKVAPEANLYTDLNIDSIDAIDIMVKLKEFTGKRLQPQEFKGVRTVQDVVDTVYRLLNNEGQGSGR